MHRPRPQAAPQPIPQFAVADNSRYCGFECPACGFQHRLSDSREGISLLDVFRADLEAHQVICPECGTRTAFDRSDLQVFQRRNED